ncbi:418_t:CDS:2 [Entrophospora sp. SA101]|nr:15776_t:CDS:2 [Entrophospora sp. SA101]CAJ0747908.1 418_t:CDS:2 [Entrophospora sp. SA101]CAJ0846619.1 5811_t:CDS:2 [Entrophospora sp. SA101]CAJ0891823.1 13091_t:CDS:2 [Entrophospora sp. SA101]
MTKVSLSSKKKPGQKYQNSFAFKPNKNSKKSKIINSLPIDGLCKRCKDIVEWKKKYKKYKTLTVAKKCVNCNEKNVKEAYHVLCSKCASGKNVCAKCQESNEIIKSGIKSDKELLREQQEHEKFLSKLSERQKRSYLRKLERGETFSLQNIQIDKENDNSDGDDNFSHM